MASKTEVKWRGIVERWRESGLTLAEYARRRGISAVTLGHWKNRLQAGKVEQLPFVEVSPVNVLGGRAPFCIERGKVRVEVPADFDGAALRRLLQVAWEQT